MRRRLDDGTADAGDSPPSWVSHAETGHGASCRLRDRWGRIRIPARVLIFALMAGYMSLAQPGVCPCWLLKDVQHIHPHPAGHPELPHTHDYLFSMFPSAPALPPNLPAESPSFVLDLTSLRGVWRSQAEAHAGGGSAGPAPPTPPPELIAM